MCYRTVPQQELGSDMAGLSYPEKYRRSRGAHWGLLGGIFLLQYGNIGRATFFLNTPQTFLPKGLFSGIPCSPSTVPGPPPCALLFLTNPACPPKLSLRPISYRVHPQGVTVKAACSFLKLLLPESPVWPLRPRQWCWVVCSGLSARGLLQRRGAPIKTHSSR